MSWRGVLSGSLALIALQASLSSDEATGRVGRMFGHVADLARRLIDPSIAAIPDLSTGAGSPAATPGAGGQAGGKPKNNGTAGGGKKPKDDGDDFDWWNPLDWNLPPGML